MTMTTIKQRGVCVVEEKYDDVKECWNACAPWNTMTEQAKTCRGFLAVVTFCFLCCR
uniref:Uncharacterized protein n=1 Tax=Oryza sativa subsp. japonica TaxID=39947 RepID=Q8H4Q8_ORYSJ|nr:hypothetical protein [Oryza sativa Japonica Group]